MPDGRGRTLVTVTGRPNEDEQQHPDSTPDSQVFDIVTPTERELSDRAIGERRRRYFLIMVPCIALVIFGFFVPAPTPLRLIALAAAAVMPPLAAIVANPPRRGR